MSDDDRAAIAELSPRANWQEVAQHARRGGIGGLIASHLAPLEAPAEIKRELSAVSLKIADHNRRLVDVALEICAAAEQEGLTLIPLKGVALHLGGVYEDLGLREQSDVDLLARPEQFEQLKELLARLGCRTSGAHEYSRRQKHHLKFAYGSERAPLLVELHWTAFFQAFQRQRSDEAALRHTRPEPCGDRTLRLLDPVDMLLSVALHLAVHRYREQIKWLVDVAELGRRLGDELDSAELWRRAAEMNAGRAVTYAFALGRELLGAPLPAPPTPPGLMGLMRRLSPPECIVESRRQPSWVRRAAIDALLT